MRDAAFFFVWAVLLPVSFYSAHVGVLLWIWVALLSPTELLYGAMAAVPFNKIVAASTLLILIASPERKAFYLDSVLVLILIFSIFVVVAYATGVQGPTPDAVFDKYWKEIVLAVLIAGVMWSRHRLHQAALVVSVSYGFLMFKEGLIFLLTAGGHKVSGTGSTGDNNGLALAILMTIPMCLYVAKYSEERLVRLAIYIVAAMGAVTVVASYSRGGFVGLIVLALMLTQSGKNRIRGLILLGVAGVSIYFLAPESWFERINTIKEASGDDSFMIRVTAWKVNFLMALDHPLFGNGLYACLNFDLWMRHMEQAANLLFPSPLVFRSFVAHSIYFQVMGDLGFAALGVFLAILSSALVMTWRTARLARKDPSLAWAGDLAKMLQISLVVYCVAGAALSLVYFELLFITLAMISRTHKTVTELLADSARAAVPARRGMHLAPAYRTAG